MSFGSSNASSVKLRLVLRFVLIFSSSDPGLHTHAQIRDFYFFNRRPECSALHVHLPFDVVTTTFNAHTTPDLATDGSPVKNVTLLGSGWSQSAVRCNPCASSP